MLWAAAGWYDMNPWLGKGRNNPFRQLVRTEEEAKAASDQAMRGLMRALGELNKRMGAV